MAYKEVLRVEISEVIRRWRAGHSQRRIASGTGLSRDLTVSATFRDTAGSREEFTRMMSEATRDDSPLDFIVVWKLNRFSMSLEETIELRDKLRRVGTRLVSTTERGIDD